MIVIDGHEYPEYIPKSFSTTVSPRHGKQLAMQQIEKFYSDLEATNAIPITREPAPDTNRHQRRAAKHKGKGEKKEGWRGR